MADGGGEPKTETLVPKNETSTGDTAEALPPIWLQPPRSRKAMVINNPYPKDEGYLADNLTLTTKISEQNECTVYYYRGITPNYPRSGTYVVVQFEPSTNYIFVNREGQLEVKKEKYWKTKAKDIKSTADPRVFLMKEPTMLGARGTMDFLLASCVASQQQPYQPIASKARVITVVPLPPTMPIEPHEHVELLPEETREPPEAQLFQLMRHHPSDHHWDEAPSLEWMHVQYPLIPPEGDHKDADKGQE